MRKFKKGFSVVLMIAFLCQNVAFCLPERSFTLRVPVNGSPRVKETIEEQDNKPVNAKNTSLYREKDGKFTHKPGGRWEDAFDTIIGSPRLFSLANRGELSINAYRDVDKRASLSTNRRDFDELVRLGYLVSDTSKKEHLYQLTDKTRSIAGETFVYKIQTMEYYPQKITGAHAYKIILREEVLNSIYRILENMEHAAVFMFDIDETLVDLKGHPKIAEDFKDLLDVLRNFNHIVGIVTHRAAMIEDLESNDEKDIIEGIHTAQQYIETEKELANLGVSIDDFDFFVISGLTPELNFVTYIRAKNRWKEEGQNVIERIIPIDAPWKASKIVSISFVDDIFSNEFGLDLFKSASMITVDDDLYQGHSLIHGNSHIAEHLVDVKRIFLQMKDSEIVQRTLNRIRKFGGILIPHVNKKEKTISFCNTPGSNKFGILKAYTEKGPYNLYFAIEKAILRQLEALDETGDEKVILDPQFPTLFIERKDDSPPSELKKRKGIDRNL